MANWTNKSNEIAEEVYVNPKKAKKKLKARYNNEDVQAVQSMYKPEKTRKGNASSSPPKVVVPDRLSSREQLIESTINLFEENKT